MIMKKWLLKLKDMKCNYEKKNSN
ncbi:hypothetical protein SB30_210136 [Klebsiella quasipneumoniae subsp. similipneumoniae]|nr:hypothetical protein SB30_210136 [Klebsiella quasipneumoniae subsp. similipneumoniae]